MNPTTAITLASAALRSLAYLLRGEIRFPTDRLGSVLERSNGDRFEVYRETTRRAPPPSDPSDRVVLVFSMHLADPQATRGLRHTLANPLANVATPFYAGLPGFRRKLWLAGENTDELLELYEWNTREDADRFVDILEALLEPFDAMGDADYQIHEDDTVDQYVASRSVRWHHPTRQRQQSRPQRYVAVGVLALLLAGAAVLIYALRSRR